MIFKRPTLELDVYELKTDKELIWSRFKKHHYLTGKLNKAARCFICVWDGIPVAFHSLLPMPSGTLKRAWRGHRLVVLCDYQGMGIGRAYSETVGDIFIAEGKRYFAKTANTKLGNYRNLSNVWRPTSKNMRRRKIQNSDVRHGSYPSETVETRNPILLDRMCFSHEYIGDQNGC